MLLLKLLSFYLYNKSLLKMSKAQKDSSSDSSQVEDQEELEITEKVQNAIKALPTLQEKIQAIALNSFLIEKRKLDEQLEKEQTALEHSIRQKYLPQLAEIQDIISGKYQFKNQDFLDIGDLLTEQELSVKQNYFTQEPISEYWLKALMNSELGEQITQKDEPLLRHLQAIEASKALDGSKISVKFTFSPNQWFTNVQINKHFDIEGDNINKSYGDKIQWKEGKNITVKIVKKKQKNKKSGQKKTKIKEVREESFFNLFRDIEITSDNEDDQENQNAQQSKEIEDLQQQYETANLLYQDLIPKSLEYYLGVMGNMDFAGEGFEGIEQEDEDEEEEEQPQKKNKSKKKRKPSSDSK